MLGENKRLKADMMLLLVTLCWGVSYYLMDLCLVEMDPFTLNAYRFLIAFAIAAALSWNKIKTVNKITLKYSFFLGIALVIVYIGATFGVKYTSLSNSGFLCAMTVVFTPMIARIFLKQKQERKVVVAVIICFIGIALLTLKDDFSINTANLKGDLLCLLCALSYAVAIEEVDAYQLGVFQLGITGGLNLILALMLEQPQLPETPGVWGGLLFLAIFCTGVAFVVQPIAQQYTTASHTCIIYALEPVFAAVVAVIFANEILSVKSYFGAFLMMASIFIMEINFSRILKSK